MLIHASDVGPGWSESGRHVRWLNLPNVTSSEYVELTNGSGQVSATLTVFDSAENCQLALGSDEHQWQEDVHPYGTVENVSIGDGGFLARQEVVTAHVTQKAVILEFARGNALAEVDLVANGANQPSLDWFISFIEGIGETQLQRIDSYLAG
jgi:hypothetical protein